MTGKETWKRRNQAKELARSLLGDSGDVDLLVDLIIDAATEAVQGVTVFESRNWEQMPLLMTPEEAALVLRCSERTVFRMLDDGRLTGAKPHRGWLIPREVVRRAALEGSEDAGEVR